MKLIFILLISFISSLSFAKNIEPTELSEILKTVGTYKNKLGVEVFVTTTVNGGSIDYTILLEHENEDLYLELSLDDFIGIDKKGSLVFAVISDHCDDAGCTDLDGEIKFKLKKDGTYYIATDLIANTNMLDADIDLDSEEDADIDLDSEEDIVKLLTDFCKDRYGDDAIFYGENAWGSCEREVKTYLKKVD